MVLANVTPVSVGLRSLKTGGVPAEGWPQLSAATIGTSVARAGSESRNMGPKNLTLPAGGGSGYHSVHAKSRYRRARVLRVGWLPRAASVRRRAARAGVLCRLPHVSPAGAAGQTHLADGRLAANGPAPGRAGAVAGRRNVARSGDGGPDEGGVASGLGEDRRVLSRAGARHVTAAVPAGPTTARSSFVYHGADRSAAAEQRDHHALENGQSEPTNPYWGGRNQHVSGFRLQPPSQGVADAGEPADRRDFRKGSAPGARIGQARAQRRAQGDAGAV